MSEDGSESLVIPLFSPLEMHFNEPYTGYMNFTVIYFFLLVKSGIASNSGHSQVIRAQSMCFKHVFKMNLECAQMNIFT